MLTNARAVAVPMKDGKGETFRMHGRLGGERCRLALGTQRKADAQRLVHRIETAFAEGVSSTLWQELRERLPRITFQALADDVGWKEPQLALAPEIKPTWEQLRMEYDAHLLKEIAKGNMRDGTRDRYMQTIKLFDAYAKGKQITLLEQITKRVIENWKLHRIEEIKRKPFSRGGTGYILDTAILRGTFNYGLSEKMITENPVVSEGKPGAKPTNGASPFSSEELPKIFEHAGVDHLAVVVLSGQFLEVPVDCVARGLGQRLQTVQENDGAVPPYKTHLQKVGGGVKCVLSFRCAIRQASRLQKTRHPNDHPLPLGEYRGGMGVLHSSVR
jgi:hypothetical protein